MWMYIDVFIAFDAIRIGDDKFGRGRDATIPGEEYAFGSHRASEENPRSSLDHLAAVMTRGNTEESGLGTAREIADCPARCTERLARRERNSTIRLIL